MSSNKKIEKLFSWLTVLHAIEDLQESGMSTHKILEELNRRYYLRKRE